ncbi:hypothetical protein NUW54_g14045 [Trametes sanguinea]|uniref:Uncharacterized protein n=1 Tax=Trametes sanguinea TaxID=158606 RepID=A0ACC1MG94_9APHY|nr:hypothetical protein NUW54_g14045 [Trametes sanguinea]
MLAGVEAGVAASALCSLLSSSRSLSAPCTFLPALALSHVLRTSPINQVDPTRATPQNTPLTHAPIAAGLSRPTVPDIRRTTSRRRTSPPPLATSSQAMLGLVHGKLSGLIGKSSGYVESLPVEVKKNVEAT